jgi:hypothetical protein
MSAIAETLAQAAPAWVTAEMPPGYQNRLAEIERLVADLEAMGRFGRLLWQVGAPLAETACDAFKTLKFDSHVAAQSSDSVVVVELDGTRRLLLLVSPTREPVQKKGAELAQAFQLLHEVAGDADRVVLLLNTEPETRPADRTQAMTPDAATLLRRMGVSYLNGATIFGLWKMSLEDLTRARTHVERLFAQDGGLFELSPSLLK